MNPDDQLEIEKLGGLAGIGLPGSRIRSYAKLYGRELSQDDRNFVDSIFQRIKSEKHKAKVGADGFRFRLTFRNKDGIRDIEVDDVELPESLQSRVEDELI